MGNLTTFDDGFTDTSATALIAFFFSITLHTLSQSFINNKPIHTYTQTDISQDETDDIKVKLLHSLAESMRVDS